MRRFGALLIALALVVTPALAEVCMARCAEHDHMVASAEAHHACHEMAPASDLALTAAPHFCGHDDGLPTAVATFLHAVMAPAVAPQVTFELPPAPTLLAVPAAVQHSPPGLVSLVSRLRV
jgi:hypothetical protein